MEKCFVIMPITTPDDVSSRYFGDKDHFQHVLDHLFIPAIKKSNLDYIPPKAKGSDLIHAEIIKQIETTDIVLCDMSALNPNVFFELGTRTALNKPVCLVKDDLTSKVPFDTGIINHHTYSGALNAWELDMEIEALSKHISTSIETSAGVNSLWKYFGLNISGKPSKETPGVEGKLELLSAQMEAMRRELGESQNLQRRLPRSQQYLPYPQGEEFLKRIQPLLDEARRLGVMIRSFVESDAGVSFEVIKDTLTENDKMILTKVGASAGFGVNFRET